MDKVAASEFLIFENAETLAHHAAAWLCALALASEHRFAISLSGGSTPRRLYERLAAPEIAARFPWSRTHWFWGDERFVPHDHPDSNYRLANDVLLARVPAPRENIHPILTEGLSPPQAAAAYEMTLKQFYGAETLIEGRPLFDVCLLGLGADGHTASLFPGHAALQERERWTLAVSGARAEARVTLTYPALDASRDIVFLAQGQEKRGAVARARAGDRALPAGMVRPAGRIHWFIDREAAAADGA